jgi:hypothetical protein
VLDAASWERKLTAIGCYASQLPVLFRGGRDYRAEFLANAVATGEGVRAEALWRVLPGDDPWATRLA